jgi:hypothetical protein
MNLKNFLEGSGRGQSTYYPDICPEELSTTRIILCAPTKIRTEQLPNTNLEFYRYAKPLGNKDIIVNLKKKCVAIFTAICETIV